MNLSEEQKLKLKEIKERLNATTQGYWERECDKIYEDFDDDPTIVSDKGNYICQTTYDFQSCTMEHNVEEDTVFIANAKNDIEYLLEVINNITRPNICTCWKCMGFSEDPYSDEFEEGMIEDEK